MSRVNFTVLHTGNPVVDRVQTHLQSTFRPILQNPLSDGVLQKGLTLSTTEKLIDHGLGRVPEGFIITKLNASAVVYESSTPDYPQNQIALKASATVTADIYFF